MIITPKFPKKVQFLLDFDFSFIDKLLPRKTFVGGRIGYDKKILFVWLLTKKVMGWDYRYTNQANQQREKLQYQRSLF